MTPRSGKCLCGALGFPARKMEGRFSICSRGGCRPRGGGPYRRISMVTENPEIIEAAP